LDKNLSKKQLLIFKKDLDQANFIFTKINQSSTVLTETYHNLILNNQKQLINFTDKIKNPVIKRSSKYNKYISNLKNDNKTPDKTFENYCEFFKDYSPTKTPIKSPSKTPRNKSISDFKQINQYNHNSNFSHNLKFSLQHSNSKKHKFKPKKSLRTT